MSVLLWEKTLNIQNNLGNLFGLYAIACRIRQARALVNLDNAFCYQKPACLNVKGTKGMFSFWVNEYDSLQGARIKPDRD